MTDMSTDDGSIDHLFVWRYMSFEKWVSMLEYHSLWFARPFTFNDQWEGYYPPSYYRNARRWAIENGEEWDDEFEQEFQKRWKRHRYATFVNCWHISDHESDAMWRLYGKGVAIRSTVGKVRECLHPHDSGKVRYYSPERDVRYETIIGPPDLLHKRESFRHENEFRAWFYDDELLDRIDATQEICESDLSRGKMVVIENMKNLIEQIIVAPGSGHPFFELVKDICVRYRLSWLGKRVDESYLDRLHTSFLRV